MFDKDSLPSIVARSPFSKDTLAVKHGLISAFGGIVPLK